MNDFAKWLDAVYQPISQNLKTKILENTVTSRDLSNELRNGELLCNLISQVIPNSIDTSKLNKNAESSRLLSCFNLNMFLDACRLNLTDLDTKYYFDAELIFDHIELRPQVLKFFIQLSKCKQLNKKSNGFQINNYKIADSDRTEQENEPYIMLNDVDNNKYQYASPLFFTSNKIDINDAFKIRSSSTITSKIFTTDYTIKEILTTEESYISSLSFLQSNYLIPLSRVISYETIRIISINVESILKVHKCFHAKLKESCEGDKGRSKRICSVFFSFKRQFFEIYSYYCSHISNSIDRIKKTEESTFKAKLDECENNTHSSNGKKFKLIELIIAPFQRLTKYPELLKALSNNTDKEKLETKQLIESTQKTMEQICVFANQCKRDQESIEKIDSLIKSLNGGLSDLNLKQYGRFIKDELVYYASGNMLRDSNKKLVLIFEKALIICNKTLNKYVYVDSFPIDDNLMFLDNRLMAKNEYFVSVTNYELSKQYCFYFKIEKLMNHLIDNIKIAKNKQTTINKTHKFTFTNFDFNFVECNVCNIYLEGIFFQGFKCDLCGLYFHQECLDRSNQCEIGLIKREPKTVKAEPVDSVVIKRKSVEFEVFKSECKHDQIDSKYKMLIFDPNEYIFMTEKIDSEIYKGFKLRFKCGDKANLMSHYKEEGYFRKSFVKLLDKSTDLSYYSWFLEGDKMLAIKILEQISDEKEVLFVVRYDRIKYVLTIKFPNKQIKHIIVLVNNTDSFSLHSSNKYFEFDKQNGVLNSNVYYSIDNYRYFISIADLINYFMKNTLNEYFRELDLLDKPYREAMPIPKYTAIANQDHKGIGKFLKLKKGKYCFIIEEIDALNCMVFDGNGLKGYAENKYLSRV